MTFRMDTVDPPVATGTAAVKPGLGNDPPEAITAAIPFLFPQALVNLFRPLESIASTLDRGSPVPGT